VLVGTGWAEVADALARSLVVDDADLAMITCVPDARAALTALGQRLGG
jgi:hypothetical protein